VARLIHNNRLTNSTSFSDALASSAALASGGTEFLAADAANTTPYKRQFTNILGVADPTQSQG